LGSVLLPPLVFRKSVLERGVPTENAFSEHQRLGWFKPLSFFGYAIFAALGAGCFVDYMAGRFLVPAMSWFGQVA